MRSFLLLALLPLFFSCTSTFKNQKEENTFTPPPLPKTALDRKLEGMGSQEFPISPPVNVNKLDLCTRYLLFADQYITASDYPEAAQELKEASKYCKKDDPRFNYMKAVVLDSQEKRKEAYKYYYLAAKGYIKKGDMDSAFKCYSNMLSIDPQGKEVMELRKYFTDEDY